jgi:phospholipase A2-like protein
VATKTLRRAIRATVAAVGVSTALVAGTIVADVAFAADDIPQVTDQYLFSTSLNNFQSLRVQQPHGDQLDWSSDGCSNSPDNPFGFNLVKACYRHDFGYRNYKRQGRFSESNRLRIDNNFKDDMYEVCNGNWACNRFADTYYFAVRQFGG